MRAKAYGISLFLLFVVAAAVQAQSKKTHPIEEIRKVGVCVLVDEKSPSNLENINVLIEQVSADYTRNVNMSFTVVETHTTKLDPKISQGLNKIGPKFRAECGGGDIVFVFTNERHFPPLFWKPSEVWGLTIRKFGISWIYNVDARFNAPCRLSTKMTVEHEIAHLFGAEDDEPKLSFMSFDYDCKDIWPETLQKIVLKNKFRTWNPHK